MQFLVGVKRFDKDGMSWNKTKEGIVSFDWRYADQCYEVSFRQNACKAEKEAWEAKTLFGRYTVLFTLFFFPVLSVVPKHFVPILMTALCWISSWEWQSFENMWFKYSCHIILAVLVNCRLHDIRYCIETWHFCTGIVFKRGLDDNSSNDGGSYEDVADVKSAEGLLL